MAFRFEYSDRLLEEIETGIHPSRLGLLIDFIETQTRERGIQVVATTHSPLALRYLGDESLEHASLVYRLPGRSDAKIKRLVDIPHARETIRNQDISILHASNWFEDVLDFAEDEDVGVSPVESRADS